MKCKLSPLASLEGMPTSYLIFFTITTLWVVFFAYQTFEFHRAHRSKGSEKVPPTYPSLVPYLGTVFPLLWNPRSALTRFTAYNGHGTVTRLSFLPSKYTFVYQDPAIIRQIWRQSSLTDFRPMSTYFHTTVCGMSEEAASLRLAQSGNQVKPSSKIIKSEVSHVHRIISHGNRQGLTGRGLATTIRRYMDAFIRKTHELVPERLSNDLDGSWTELDDLWDFIKDTAGASEIEALFGPNLTRMHPTFVRTFFEYGKMGPQLLMGVPPKRAERVRSSLLYQFKTWRRYAKKHFTDSAIYEDGDGDPFWGSAWTRYRHREFAYFFDDDAISSHDLSVAWGSLENTIPCTLMAVIHVLEDASLTSRVKREIDEACSGGIHSDGFPLLDPDKLSKSHLLSSIYAETLRLHVSVSIPVIPMHGDLILGKWRIPKGSYGLISSGICHTNRDTWNTKDGSHQLESFWAERFIFDPTDPLSGPIRTEADADKLRVGPGSSKDKREKKEPYFTTEGLEGSWIPYGGGQNMCPGRFLAKSVIQFTLALLVTKFDIELRTNSDPIVMDKYRFGFGADIPSFPIPFRIRRKMRD